MEKYLWVRINKIKNKITKQNKNWGGGLRAPLRGRQGKYECIRDSQDPECHNQKPDSVPPGLEEGVLGSLT